MIVAQMKSAPSEKKFVSGAAECSGQKESTFCSHA
jgi:hypothetical protein